MTKLLTPCACTPVSRNLERILEDIEKHHPQPQYLKWIKSHVQIIKNQIKNCENQGVFQLPQRIKPLVFLCAPLTAEKRITRAENLEIANKAALFLMQNGFSVFSPVSHGMQIIEDCDNDEERDALIPYSPWEELNLSIMQACDAVCFIDSERALASKGMQEEIKIAHHLGMDIFSIYQGENENFLFSKSNTFNRTPYPITHVFSKEE